MLIKRESQENVYHSTVTLSRNHKIKNCRKYHKETNFVYTKYGQFATLLQ